MRAGLLLAAAARGAAGAGWADEIAAALPNSTLWQATWAQLGAHWPEHSLSAAEKQALLVPLARGGPSGSPLAGGVFPFFEANAPDQLRSQLDNLQGSAARAAEIGEAEFFSRLVPSAGAAFADTVTVFDRADHGEPVPGTAGVDLFRIPSLVDAGGTLLAFAEARATNGVEPGQDCVPTGIALKRSLGGLSFGELSFPVPPTFKPATPNGLGDRSANPVTIWEPGRSRVHLHFLRGARTETDCAPGGADDAANFINYYTFSDDRGETWADPIDISDQLGPFRGCMPGPDKGVAVEVDGEVRLVVPCHLGTSFRENGETIVYYSVGMADDGTASSWNVSSLGAKMDETTITAVPKASGTDTLVVSMRNVGGTAGIAGQPERDANTRAVRHSEDGGVTWGPISFPPELPDPASEGSLCTAGFDSGQSLLLFSNAPMVWARSRLSLHLSADRGQSWGAMMDGDCTPANDPAPADASAATGASCRGITDGATFSDYSSLTCGAAGAAAAPAVTYSVLYGTCDTPFPFQVWCQLPHAWSVKLATGSFGVTLPAAPPPPPLLPHHPRQDLEQEVEEEGAPVLMLLLCAVLGCAVLQLCRGLCRRRVVDGRIEKFMVAYREEDEGREATMAPRAAADFQRMSD